MKMDSCGVALTKAVRLKDPGEGHLSPWDLGATKFRLF